MIQIYPVPGSDNNRWVVKYEFHGLASSTWGQGEQQFDNWGSVIYFINQIHRKERRLRKWTQVKEFFHG